MKKQKLLPSILFTALLFFSCSETNNDNCSDLQFAAETAEENYNSNNTEETCNSYKDALNAQISSCGDESGALQSILDGLGDCSETTTQGTIIVTVGGLLKTFDENITITQNGATLTIRAEHSLTNDWISFEVEQGGTGIDIISNFKIFLVSREYFPTSNSAGTFTSSITTNTSIAIEGSFSGPVEAANNAVVDLTSGMIDLGF